MVETTVLINTFLDEHLIELIIAGGVVFGFVILYKKLRKIPAQVDFVKVFEERNIKDEELNKPNKLDPKWLYRGEEKLGRIFSTDTKHYTNSPTKEEYETKAGIKGWEGDITTITFKQKDFMGMYLFSHKKLLRFRPDEAIVSGKKLIFSSDVGFTAMGNEYATKTAFKEISSIIEAEYSKRLLEANVNVMASKMSHISAETPEMAHELALKRLDIEKIRAEKQQKIGGLI